jgi:hypothetical protein
MSEKIYACLIRLYPSRFRKEYTQEALQLFRDRLRDESGFLRRIRLWCDLLIDLPIGLPLAWRNSYAEERPAAISTGAVPSFQVLQKEPLRPSSIFAGCTLSLTALIAFGFLMSRAPAYSASSFTHGPESPIDAVLQRLNRATSTQSVGGGDAKNAEAGTGGQVGEQSQSAVPNSPVSAAQTLKSNLASGAAVVAIPVQTTTSGGVQAASAIPGTRSTAIPVPFTGNADRRQLSGVPSAPVPNAERQDVTAPVHRMAEAMAHPGANARVNGERGQSAAMTAQPHPENAVKAMMGLFQSHDIVMFGEVHDNKQEYEWLCNLVKSPGFADHVDDIVVEFGNAHYQRIVDRYVAGEDLPYGEVQKAWRNMVADTEPVSPVYGWLYRAVREANLQHPGKRIRLLMGSPAADWDKIRTSADLAPYEAEREQWYAEVVKRDVLAKHHRALLIMGAWHFLRGHDQALAYEIAAQQQRALPAIDRAPLGPGYIERELRAADANPYLVVFGTNVIDGHGDVDHRFDAWNAPVIVPLANNWVGNLAAQPVLTGGHAAPIPITLGQQADALLYVAPCSALKSVYLSRSELDGTQYGKEMVRRDKIELGRRVDFQYGEVPQCVN